MQRGQGGHELEGYVAGMHRTKGYAICAYSLVAFRK
jgi:hypothetical protein